MAGRERRRTARQKRKARSAARRSEVAARYEERNRAARDALEPLAPDERPAIVTVGAVVSAAVALSAVIAYLAGAKVGGDRPHVLQVIAEWSPVTCVVSAARDLFGNSDGGRPTGNFATTHPAAMSLIWSLAILVVFVPLAVRKYKRSASR